MPKSYPKQQLNTLFPDYVITSYQNQLLSFFSNIKTKNKIKIQTVYSMCLMEENVHFVFQSFYMFVSIIVFEQKKNHSSKTLYSSSFIYVLCFFFFIINKTIYCIMSNYSLLWFWSSSKIVDQDVLFRCIGLIKSLKNINLYPDSRMDRNGLFDIQRYNPENQPVKNEKPKTNKMLERAKARALKRKELMVKVYCKNFV